MKEPPTLQTERDVTGKFSRTSLIAMFTIGGYYTDDLARVDGEWRISAKRLTVLWNSGNPQVLALARERAAELLATTA